MIGHFNIPNNDSKTQVFYSYFTGSTNQWQIWNKPYNCTFVHITVIGGGGGGGAGLNGASGAARTGGAGGGSSSITKGFFPANSLPDRLYIQVGKGGLGGITSGGSGSPGSLSYVSVEPNTTSINILLQSGNVAATAGVGAGLGGIKNGGTSGSTFTPLTLTYLGIIDTEPGQNGVTNSGNGDGVDLTISNILTGGAGGGSVDSNIGVTGVGFNGGDIISLSGLVNTIKGGISTPSNNATGTTGSSYLSTMPTTNLPNRLPFFSSGGSGGGSGILGARGGDASYGSGGGGGAVSGNAVTPFNARGGNGGDGLVIITCL
jgi:hypothetical protein